MAFTFNDFAQYHKDRLATATVSINYGKLSDRERNAVLKSLRTGVIETDTYRGSGKYAKDLLQLAAVPFLSMSSRAKWKYVHASRYAMYPEDVKEALCNFVIAQHTANTLRGMGDSSYMQGMRTRTDVEGQLHARGWVSVTADRQRKLGGMLAEMVLPYTCTEKYKDAVAAAISVVETGHVVKFELQH